MPRASGSEVGIDCTTDIISMQGVDVHLLSDSIPPPPPPPPPPPEELEEFVLLPEVNPRFPGCEERDVSDKEKEVCAENKLFEFIEHHLQYPEVARINKSKGPIIVELMIDKEGLVKNARIRKNLRDGCGKEVMRIIELMEEPEIRWTPARHKGKVVTSRYMLAVNFKI